MHGDDKRQALDWLVLTAANRAQARGYEAQLRARQADGALGACARWLVIPDPGGRRVGSGGSTFAVLLELAKRLSARRRGVPASFAELFTNQRILIIHSGGDSRRLPAFAAQGKIFTPLPCETRDGRPADLFDLVLDDLLGVPLPESGRVLIASGDVMLGIARHRPRVDAPGVVGVAYPAEIERGSRHGVYVCDSTGGVTDFLQKPSAQTSVASGAVDAAGRVLVDLGLVSLDPAHVDKWLTAAGARCGRRPATAGGLLRHIAAGSAPTIDLYHHVLRAIPARVGLHTYLDEVAPTAGTAREVCAALYHGLHGLPFTVAVVPECDFLHIGTSREFLTTVGGDARIRARSAGPGSRRLVVYNSDGARPRPPATGVSIIESCDLSVSLRLAGDNIAVGIPRFRGRSISLSRGVGLICLPIGSRGWAAVATGDRDDAKSDWRAGGTLAGRPIQEILSAAGLKPEDAWSPHDQEQTLWTARLWRIGSAAQSIPHALRLVRGGSPDRGRRWKRASLAELMPRVNHDRLIAARADLQRRERLARAPLRLAADPWLAASDVAADIRSRAEATRLLRNIDAMTRSAGSALAEARLCRLAAVVCERNIGRSAAARRNNDAFAAVASAVAGELDFPTRPRAAATLTDQVVWVTTPVRIDFHGGWSDTPPICHEWGGSVVNAAITLNGQYPVQVMARVSDEPRIRLTSVDLGSSVTLTRSEQVCAFSDPFDWGALAKAALVLSGIAPSRPKESLKRWLAVLGGGLDLTMFAALPKGSGLGTSSILGAALLACIDRVLGRELSPASLIRRTSLLEQMMSTAGGWQDQAGGITPGVKLLRTEPGRDQLPHIVRAPLDTQPGSPLAGRMLLYYTGYRRLARDILHNVVGRYLARDPESLRIVHRLKAGAERMRSDLEGGDAEGFCRGVSEYWELKKAFDPGSTNARIEAIVRPVARYLSAYELPGAGGGGFVFMIARDPDAAARVRSALTRRPPNRLARFYDFAIDQKGIAVSTL